MKVLFLTSRLPWPPDRGDRVRTYHFLREMAARHEVTLLSFTDGTAPAVAICRLGPVIGMKVVREYVPASGPTIGVNALTTWVVPPTCSSR